MQNTDTRSDIRARQINGLRLLADFLTEYPGLPVPTVVAAYVRTDDEVSTTAASQGADLAYLDGITRANLIFDGIEFEVVHVSEQKMVEQAARNSYQTVVQP